MTREEIINMPAGYEMNNLIGQRVMGWHFDADGNWEDGHGEYPDMRWWEYRFSPSTDIEAAWSVVEKLCNENGCDVVKVCKRDPELLRGEWSCNFGLGFEAFGESASLAICRAALLAVMDGE